MKKATAVAKKVLPRMPTGVAGFDQITWGGERLVGKGVTLIDAEVSQSVERAGEFDLVGLLAMVQPPVASTQSGLYGE